MTDIRNTIKENFLKLAPEVQADIWNEAVGIDSEDTIHYNDEDFWATHFANTFQAVYAVDRSHHFSINEDWVLYDSLGNVRTANKPIDLMQLKVLLDSLQDCEEFCKEWKLL